MKALNITEKAKQQIENDLAGSSSLIFGVGWSGLNYKKGEWVIGYFDKRKVSKDDGFLVVSGLQILSDPLDRPYLEGKTIDFIDGKLIVI